MKFYRLIIALLLIQMVQGCTETPDFLKSKTQQVEIIKPPYLEKQGTATRLVVKGKPFLLISGELHNSTCGGYESMKPVWQKMAKKNLNSVIATVSWELIEPEQGKFNFALVDSMITGARKANLRLVLIWFASWKNASSVYIPSWVKRDYNKYPRAKDEHGKTLEILSTFGDASREADCSAFAALMKHLRETDGRQQTVVMVQVENEVGILDHLGKTPGNARRDFSDAANTAYNGPVPAELINYLNSHKNNLFPELSKVWQSNGSKTSGTWEEVFGKSEFKPDAKDWQFYSYYTEELFSAWNYASYIQKVVAAGKKVYALPMYVNAWLKQPFSYWPGRYPSGGPLPQVIDIWRAAAPSIDFIAPDIYTDEFTWVCKEYTGSGNPLFIPETQRGDIAAMRAFYAFGEFDAGCFAPFGIDQSWPEGTIDPLDETYKVLGSMSDLILGNQGKGNMRGILVTADSMNSRMDMGNFRIEARLAGNQKAGGGIIIKTGPQEFIVAGKALDVFFSTYLDSTHVGIIAVNEGIFLNKKWIPLKRLNGDEVHASTWSGTGMKLPDDRVSIQKISLYLYK
jgi:hypothetical protein